MGKEKASSVGSLGNMQNERSYILSEIKGIPPITAEIVCSELSKGTPFNSSLYHYIVWHKIPFFSMFFMVGTAIKLLFFCYTC